MRNDACPNPKNVNIYINNKSDNKSSTLWVPPGAGGGASKALRGGDIQQEEDARARGQSAVQADQHPGVPSGGPVSDWGSEGHQEHCSGGNLLCVYSLFF